MRLFLIITFFATIASLNAQITPVGASLDVVATGFSSPTGIYNAGDERLFILEKDAGRIKIIDLNGNDIGTFLDIDDLVQGGGERGLLGLAFHPNYQSNGLFFVNYTRNGGDTVIARYQVSGDPNVANASSAEVLLVIDQPFGNHNGGHIAFGPDGYLYIGMGDGGSGYDPLDSGQDASSLLGKMLRIDIDGTGVNGLYSIPSTNPFSSSGEIPGEIWALGLRNPWKFSFDDENGDLWIADVGQDAFEEVHHVLSSNNETLNFGWRCYEGNILTPGITCNAQDYGPGELDFPVADFSHSSPESFCSITGGYVYRGSNFPGLQGHYLFTDYCNGSIWSIKKNGDNYEEQILLNAGTFGYVAFGEDVNNELYICHINNGTVYRITETCGDFNPQISSDGNGTIVASSGVDYSWYRDGNLIGGASGSSYTPSESGEYYALIDNGECVRQSNSINWGVISGPIGCTYIEAENFSPDAMADDGSCVFGFDPLCPADLSGDGIVNSGDLGALLTQFGTVCD